jgi:hypothetical protein
MAGAADMIDLGQLSIPVADYAIQGNAILGIKESGKTYTAINLAEQLLDAGIPFIAFDWIGVWKNIKRPGKGKGYPVVVAGGRDGDLPLSTSSTPEIIRAAMSENIPLVIDLYDRNLPKTDKRRIMQTAVEILLDENEEHGVRHIFFEEAAEAVPQRIGNDQTKLYSAIESLARMGGNALVGYTLINQRAEEVNKAVLEICDCLILMRQRGKNSLLSLSKWLSAGSVEDEKAVSSTLATLPTGEAWVWTRDKTQPVRVKIQEKNSFHPNRKDTARAPMKAKAAVDVSAFVERLGAVIPKIVEEKKSNDPAALRKEIATLRRELVKAGEATPDTQIVERLVEVPVLDEVLMSVLRGEVQERRKQALALEKGAADLEELIAKAEQRVMAKPVPAPLAKPAIANVHSFRPAAIPSQTDGDLRLKTPHLRVLTALTQFDPEPLDNQRIAVLAGYSVTSGSFGTTLGDLRRAGYIEGGGDQNRITPAGLAALGPFEELPTGHELRRYWISKLPRQAATILKVLCDAFPEELRADQVAVAADYSPTSGSFGTALGRLRTLRLIEGPGTAIVASSNLFD